MISLCVFFLFAAYSIAQTEEVEKDTRASKNEYLDKKTEELKTSTSTLKKEWELDKEKYKNRFSEVLKNIETYIDELNLTLDYGDKALRKKINDHTQDLMRIRDDFRKIHSEIVAATAVKWSNIKANIDKAAEKTKQKIGDLTS